MKRLLACFLLVCMLFSLVACGGNTQKETQNEQNKTDSGAVDSSENVEKDEPMEITIAIPAEPSWLDPTKSIGEAGGYVSRGITEYLVAVGNNGTEYVPCLAESWEQGNGFWTVHLRQGVTFHNGEAFTAEDVIASFERMKNKEEPNIASTNLDAITEMEALDDYTVKFVTEDTGFLNMLCNVGINPKDTLEEMGADAFSSAPVGTGPYKFIEWVPGGYIKLEAYENYWGEKADIDIVNYRFIPEASTRVAELVSGGVDVITNLNPEYVNTINNSLILRPSPAHVLYTMCSTAWTGALRS